MYHAEKEIYSKLETEGSNWSSQYGPPAMSLWVYETDLQVADKEVYKSDMVWPNDQHEVVYICLGLEAIRPADRRCKSNNMTVVFTEGLLSGQRQTNDGTLRGLNVRGFNDFLAYKEMKRGASSATASARRSMKQELI